METKLRLLDEYDSCKGTADQTGINNRVWERFREYICRVINKEFSNNEKKRLLQNHCNDHLMALTGEVKIDGGGGA